MEYRAGGQLRLSVIVFLTLQHRVVVGGKLGPLHSHSCSVEIEVSPPRGDTIPFAEIETEIKAQITPLDGKTLNDLANFQGINPTVENFAAHLCNRLSLIAAEYGAVLHAVTVRESPTRAVKYLREAAYMATSTWDGDEERRSTNVLRLPVSPPEDPEIDNVRRLRTPVEQLPLSPNQRPSSDFQPIAPEPAPPDQAPAGMDGEAKLLGLSAGRPEQPPVPEILAPLPKERPEIPNVPAKRHDGRMSPAEAAMWAADEAMLGFGPAEPPVKQAPKGKAAGRVPQLWDDDSFGSPEAPSQVSPQPRPVAPPVPAPVARTTAPAPAASQPEWRYPPSSLGGIPSRKDRKRKGNKGRQDPPGYNAARADRSSDSRPRAVGEMRAVAKPEPEPEEHEDDEGGPRAAFFKRPLVLTSLILLVFLGATAFLYRRILWPPPGQGYPWGSDTWGHIKKAQFLLQEILNKNYFPCFSPMWYNGVEPFRYWAPLPYYLLVGLMRLLRDPFLAAGWFVALCAFVGGAGWLLMKDRLGTVESALAGFVWLFWQDNVRVAMSEGNLPRTLVTAILPYLLHCFLLVLEKPAQKHFGRFALLAAVSSVAILSHAMIAATFFIGVTLMGVFWAFWMGIKAKALFRGVLGIFAGIGLTAWWLVPSLQSGLMAVNKEAVSEAMQYFPIAVSMNPYLRLKQPEIFYWGLSLAAVVAIIIGTWTKRTRLAQSSIVVALAFVAITTPTFKPLYSSIPMHHLIFPLYMATVASGIFILAVFSWKKGGTETRRDAMVRLGVSVLAALILAIDAYPSTALVNTRTEPAYLKDLSRHMPEGGWREATLDLSRFGSAATYLLGQETNRELVYGWAWQGATTAPNIVAMNTALETGFYPYLVDRLVEVGATHLVVRRGVADDVKLEKEMTALGYTENWRSSEAIVLSASGGPYVLRTEYQGIVIGKFAPNWTKLYPALAMGASNQIDKYSYEDLSQYKAIVISGAVWEDRTKAEDLVSRLASAGKTILVDLEGLPEDVLSKRPVFLGVTGEPVLIYRAPQLFEPMSGNPMGTLKAFDDTHYPWKALTPQGVDQIYYQFPHLGENVSVLGSRKIGGGTVWFVGTNLPYHAYLTRDPLALDIISKVIGVAPDATPVRTKLQMSVYNATAKGYFFTFYVPPDMDQKTLTIPVASRENMIVRVDGVQVRSGSLHSLLTVQLDAGSHAVEIVPLFPSSMRNGAWVSLGVLTFLALILAGGVITRASVPFRKPVVSE